MTGRSYGTGIVTVNGANGPAFGVFFCLPQHGAHGVVFCGDQRKYSSQGIGQWRATDLVQAIRDQAPRCLPEGSRVVAAVFSLFPSFNVETDADARTADRQFCGELCRARRLPWLVGVSSCIVTLY